MSDHELLTSPGEIRQRIGATGSFSLNSVSGDIRIRAADTDEVVVRARWDGGGDDRPLPLIVRRTDTSLQIDTEEQGGWFSFRNRGSVDFEVAVPVRARVEITAVSADIASNGLLGDQSYRTVSGDVAVDGCGGKVSAVSVSGDVQVTGVEAVEVNVTTTSGDAEVNAPVLQPVRMKTVSGDMNVRGGFASGPQHTVESVSGDLMIEATSGLTVDTKRGLDFSKKDNRPIVAGDGSANLRFRSLSGDVHVSGFSVAMAPAPPRAPAPPEPPFPPAPPVVPAAPQMSNEDSMEILRALERGEIDVEEASRRLEGAASRG
jgi:hypothetical protein